MGNGDRGGGRHSVSTVPPPAGEDDIYDAKTQVGGLSPEALAMLRQIKDEAVPSTRTAKDDAIVPVFEDDSEARSEGKFKVAAKAPTEPSEAASAREAEHSRELERAIRASMTDPVVPRAPAVPRDLGSAPAVTSPVSPPSPVAEGVRTQEARRARPPTPAEPTPAVPAAPSSHGGEYLPLFAPLAPADVTPPAPAGGKPKVSAPLVVAVGCALLAFAVAVLAQAFAAPPKEKAVEKAPAAAASARPQ